jgi:hypothetical protein
VPSARSKDVVTLVDVSGALPTPVPGARFDMGEGAVRVQLTAPTSYAVVVRPTRTSCDAADSSFPFDRAVIRPCWINEEEPNDSLAAAQPTDLALDSGVDIGASIDATDDYYSFVVPAGATGAIFGVVHSIIGNYGSCPPGLIVQGELLDEQGNGCSAPATTSIPASPSTITRTRRCETSRPGATPSASRAARAARIRATGSCCSWPGPGNGTVVIATSSWRGWTGAVRLCRPRDPSWLH